MRWWGGFLAIGAAVASLALPSAGAATARPDLVVSALSEPPAQRLPGDTFSVTTTTKNAGAARAGASTTRFYLSTDAVRGATDLALAPGRAVPALDPSKISRGTTTVTIPVAAALGSYRLIACADDLKKVVESAEGNNCRASSSKLSVTRDSIQKIQAALEAGDIDAETALQYEVFASFADPRLPSQYRGYDANLDDDSLTLQAAGEFDGLSVEQQAVVGPFLVPPSYAGSWTDGTLSRPSAAADPCTSEAQPRQTWHSTTAAGVSVRVWWPDGLTNGSTLAGTIFTQAKDVILPKLIPLMEGHPLPSDAGLGCNGGDGKVDIYLLPRIARAVLARGFTVPPKTWDTCSATPSFVELSVGTAGPARLPSVAAHELMHVLQLTYAHTSDCLAQNQWLMEAMGKWAEDFVYPAANYEQQEAPAYLAAPWETLSNHGTYPYSYPAYLFLQYVARAAGLGAPVVNTIWANTAAQAPTEAIATALGGSAGLRDRWAEFARFAWNRTPVARFKQWDGLAGGAQGVDLDGNPVSSINVDLQGTQQTSLEMLLFGRSGAGLGPVSGLGAIHYDFKVKDDDARLLEFRNPFSGGSDQAASVQGLVRLADGTWKVQDWTSVAKKRFCRDLEGQDVVEVVEIIGNSSTDEGHTLDAPKNPELVVKADCLPEHFQGSFSGTHSEEAFPDYTESWNGTIRWKRFHGDCVTTDWCTGSSTHQAYVLDSGQVDATVSGTIGSCSIEGSGSFILTRDDRRIHLFVQRHPASGHGRKHFGFVDQENPMMDATLDCGDGPTPTQWPGYTWWYVSSAENKEGTPDDTLSGSIDRHDNAGNIDHYDWSFSPAD